MGQPDGTYLFRERLENPADFILGIVFQGKPTHHLVSSVPGGWAVNGTVYENCIGLSQV